MHTTCEGISAGRTATISTLSPHSSGDPHVDKCWRVTVVRATGEGPGVRGCSIARTPP